jgi:hypothetical protein
MEKGVYMKAGRTGVADETMTNDNCVLKFSACSSSPKELCLQSGSKYFTAWESSPVGPAGQRYGTSAPSHLLNSKAPCAPPANTLPIASRTRLSQDAHVRPYTSLMLGGSVCRLWA